MAYKPLNDWLDKQEGKEVGSTMKNIDKEKERQGVNKRPAKNYQALAKAKAKKKENSNDEEKRIKSHNVNWAMQPTYEKREAKRQEYMKEQARTK